MSAVDPNQPYPGYSSWPENVPDHGQPPGQGQDYWSGPQPPGGAGHRHQARRAAAVRVPPTGPGYPDGLVDGAHARGAHAGGGAQAGYTGGRATYAGGTPARYPGGAHAKAAQRWSAQSARTNEDTGAQGYYEPDLGGGPTVMLTEPPARGNRPAGAHARRTQTAQIAPDEASLSWSTEDLRGADPVEVAERILSDADYQAEEIRREASAHAAAIREAAEREATDIRQLATAETAPVREGAEREAAAIREGAEREAAAIREGAEREAAELRAAFLEMSAQLGRVAAHITETLGAPALPTIAPAPANPRPALPGARPAPPDTGPAEPDTKPARPATKPARPDTKRSAAPTAPARPDGPAGLKTAPAKKPQKRSRQQQAMRVATAGTAGLLSIAAIGAVTTIGLHGFSFFTFRESGQGETPGNFKDANFLARQAAAQHHDSAPKGRHHKTSHGTVEVHHN